MDGGIWTPMESKADRLLKNRQMVQHNLLQAIYAEARKGTRRILVELKTGGGKTHIGAMIARNSMRIGNRSLFVTPRRRLTDQASVVFSHYSESPVSYLMAGRPYDHEAMVHVACDRTLNLRMQRAKKTYNSNSLFEFLSGADLPKFKVIMIDECHLGDATPLMKAYPDAVFIGFSATPIKSDGTGLGSQYDAKVQGPTTKELIELGLLLPVKAFNSDVKIPCNGNADPVLLGRVVDNWIKNGENRQTVLYAKSLEHSKYMVERFLEVGIPAEHIDYRVSDEPGADGKSERDRIYERLITGKTKVLCNYKLVRFGVDIPPVGCVILANPSRNMVLGVIDFHQEVGRGRRPHDEQEDMFLFDHTNTVKTLGHPDEEFNFPLHATRKQTVERIRNRSKEKDKPEPKKVVCASCGHRYEVAKECPACGAVTQFATGEYIAEVNVELNEYGKAGKKNNKAEAVWQKDDAIRFCREVLGYYIGKPTQKVPAKIFYAQRDRGIQENVMLGYQEIWELKPLPCSVETARFLENKRKQFFKVRSAMEARKARGTVNKKRVA